jgi:hypothetical protein
MLGRPVFPTTYAGHRGRVALIGTLALLTSLPLTGCANSDMFRPGEVPTVTREVLDDLEGELALPSMDIETMDWLNTLQMDLMGDGNFGSPSISDDRTTVTIVYFGEPSTQLASLVEQAPEAITVVITSAPFRPADLNELVQKAISAPGLVPGVDVSMAGPENDSSGIHLGIVELPRDALWKRSLPNSPRPSAAPTFP